MTEAQVAKRQKVEMFMTVAVTCNILCNGTVIKATFVENKSLVFTNRMHSFHLKKLI